MLNPDLELEQDKLDALKVCPSISLLRIGQIRIGMQVSEALAVCLSDIHYDTLEYPSWKWTVQAELALWESYLIEDSFITGPDITLAGHTASPQTYASIFFPPFPS
jgi:hypothetical protein